MELFVNPLTHARVFIEQHRGSPYLSEEPITEPLQLSVVVKGRFGEFLLGFAVELHTHPVSRERNRSNTSSAGIDLTEPLSSSLSRR